MNWPLKFNKDAGGVHKAPVLFWLKAARVSVHSSVVDLTRHATISQCLLETISRRKIKVFKLDGPKDDPINLASTSTEMLYLHKSDQSDTNFQSIS